MKRILAMLVALALWGTACAAELYHGMRALQRGDLQGAYRMLKESAEEGDVMAARALGGMLHRGVDIQGGQKMEARPEEAVKWFRMAAEKGDIGSAEMLGVMFGVGRGIPRDPRESLAWFRRAGKDVDAALIEKYPEGEREEIAAWILAYGTSMRRELKPPRNRGRAGTIEVIVHADSGKIEVSGSDGASGHMVEGVEAYGKQGLELSPPSPAAVKHGVRLNYTINYVPHPPPGK